MTESGERQTDRDRERERQSERARERELVAEPVFEPTIAVILLCKGQPTLTPLAHNRGLNRPTTPPFFVYILLPRA